MNETDKHQANNSDDGQAAAGELRTFGAAPPHHDAESSIDPSLTSPEKIPKKIPDALANVVPLPSRPGRPPGIPKTGGRKPGSKNRVTKAIADMAAPYGRRAFRKLAKLMESEDEKIALAASREILDRGFGRPVSPTEISGPDKTPITTQELPEIDQRETARRVAMMLSRAGFPITGPKYDSEEPVEPEVEAPGSAFSQPISAGSSDTAGNVPEAAGLSATAASGTETRGLGRHEVETVYTTTRPKEEYPGWRPSPTPEVNRGHRVKRRK